jgi:hypothetical protein
MQNKTTHSELLPFEFIQGGPAGDGHSVKEGAQAMEGELKAGFDAGLTASRPDELNAALISMLANTEGKQAQLRRIADSARRQRDEVDPAKTGLSAPSRDTRILRGTIGLARSAPYDWDWKWKEVLGAPGLAQEPRSDKSSGWMSMDTLNTGAEGAQPTVSIATAVGNFFQPSAENTIVRLRSFPAISYSWGTFCALGWANAKGWIGLVVQEYNIGSNLLNRTLIQQQQMLWDNQSRVSGTGWINGSNTGYPLFAEFEVDRSHWYALWVWSGVFVNGSGSGFLNAGYARSIMTVHVPSILWEQF